MKAHQKQFAVRDMCEAFGVARSHYYAYRNGPAGVRAKQDEELSSEIKRIFEAHRRRYGSPRITRELRDCGWQCGENRVAKLMRSNGIRAKPAARFVPATTDSNHGSPVAPNRLRELEQLDRINQVWTSDITYIPLVNGWAYLAVIMDLFSRYIVGWSLQDHLRSELVIAALSQALSHRQPLPGMLHHSDQGTQYASFRYQKMLAEHQIVPSMSRRGNCYDNAAMESFFGTLKSEMAVSGTFLSQRQANTELFKYIEIYYNRKRLHSSLEYQSPAEFEAALK